MQMIVFAIGCNNYLQKKLFLAILTETKNSQMPQLSTEVERLKQNSLKRKEHRFANINYSATLPANQMMVMPPAFRVIPNTTFPQVYLIYHAELLEQLQSAVYGRDIDLRVSGYYLGIYFFGVNDGIAMLDNREYHRPLWRQPITPPAQLSGYVPRLLHFSTLSYKLS